MIALTLALTLVSGGVDRLGNAELLGLKFKAPVEWQKTNPDDNSLQWDEPESGAVMGVTVFPVDPQRPARACLNQMVDALGKDGFTMVTLGTQPAAKKVATDQLADPNAPAPEAPADGGPMPEPVKSGPRVTSTTVIGCNGKVKWVLTWTAKTTEGARFGPILKRVLESIAYGK
ncbi:MAG: hypothetical protein U0228_27135 [Myxococcaceae bacterium]